MINDYEETDEEYACLDEDTLYEIEEDRKLNIIGKFKEYIQKEPEFYGINNICSREILYYIEKFEQNKKEKIVITDYQVELFEDLYIALYSESGDIYLYNKIANIIFNRVYV